MKRRIAIIVTLLIGVLFAEFVRIAVTKKSRPFDSLSRKSADKGGVPVGPEIEKEWANYLPDVTVECDLNFQHVVGPLGTYFVPEVNGSGGALFDFDNDGDLDVYLLNCGRSPKAVGDFPSGTDPRSRLFRNDEGRSFVDVTSESGLGEPGYAIGCTVGDIDNDGDLDVYVTTYGQDRLYRNNGNGRFEDVTSDCGIVEHDWGTGAAFFDYDNDGLLDLIVVNYTEDPRYGHTVACGNVAGKFSYCGPFKSLPTVDRLYHNDGLKADANGRLVHRFTDVTEASGISNSKTNGFNVICADFNADGRCDIYIANDMAGNRLWINQGNGKFADEAQIRGVAANRYGIALGSMGSAIGDIDRDGDLDIVVTNLVTEAATVYINDGNGYFADATRDSGVREPSLRHTGWGVALVDLDHDGWLDMPMVNGLVVPGHNTFPPHGDNDEQQRTDVISDPVAFWHEYDDDNVLLMGSPLGRFVDRCNLAKSFCRSNASGRGLIYGDVDNDGDVDLLVTNNGGKVRLYRNDLPKHGTYLHVRCIEPELHRDAIGAVVTVMVGEKPFTSLVHVSASYLASNDMRLHFGFGPSDSYDRIIVTWPNGGKEQFPGGRTNLSITLRRGEGTAIEEK